MVRAGISATWNILPWSGSHEFEPQPDRTWDAWYFCPVGRTWTKNFFIAARTAQVAWPIWIAFAVQLGKQSSNNSVCFTLMATYCKCLQWSTLEGIDESDDLTICRDEDKFSIRTKLYACPITFFVLLKLKRGKWTLEQSKTLVQLSSIQARSQTYLWGGVKSIKFGDLLWLRVDYLAIALNLAILGRSDDPPDPPPATGLQYHVSDKHE